MTAISLIASLALAAAVASTAGAQSAVSDPDTGSGAKEATSKQAVDRGGDRARQDRDAKNAATTDAPLVAKPAIRMGSLVRPVSGTAAAGPTRPRLEIVDAGREDVGPLATSLRSDPVDQRLPTSFDRVYRVPGSESLLMRGNGALFAVFDEGVYRRSGAALPPGTVFHIGMPDLRPTEYGLGHPPSDAEIGNAPASVRPASIGGGPIDRRIRPSASGSTPLVDLRGSDTGRAIFAPISLDSLLGIVPAEPVAGAHAEAMRAAVADASRASQAAFAPLLAGPIVGVAMVGSDMVDPATTSDARVTGSSDPYAHLRLGPARIARAE